jgi:hypothetical protein
MQLNPQKRNLKALLGEFKADSGDSIDGRENDTEWQGLS